MDKFVVEVRTVGAGLKVEPVTSWMMALDESTSMVELQDALAGRLYLSEDQFTDMSNQVAVLSIVK